MNFYNFTISDDAVDKLIKYEWPGNVRQLKSMLQRFNVLNYNSTVTLSDVEDALERLHYNENRNNNEEDNPKIRELTQPDYNLEDCGKYNYEYERDKIIQVLRESNMSITKASNILGISRKTLYSKMKKYKIEIERQINTVL